jgi:hypothetical protein
VGLDVNRQVAVYHRWASLDDGSVDNVVVVPNFSPEHREINPPVPFDGLWVDLLAATRRGSRRWSNTAWSDPASSRHHRSASCGT